MGAHAGRTASLVVVVLVGALLLELGDAAPVSGAPPAPPGRGAQYVYQPDQRLRITPTTYRPWSAVVLLTRAMPDGTTGTCSGVLVGPDAVLTAAHCLYGAGGWVRSVIIEPGRDGAFAPYGWRTARTFSVPTGWRELDQAPSSYRGDTHAVLDYGLVVLPDTALGLVAGWQTMAALSDATLTGLPVGVVGYPTDEPTATLWSHTGPLAVDRAADPAGRLVAYRVSTWYGNSGGPVWAYSDGQVVAVNTHQIANQSGEYPNWGRRVDATVVAFAAGVCAQVGCQVASRLEPPPPPPPPPPSSRIRLPVAAR
jgi:V8-like Glu-specific endopeptidase